MRLILLILLVISPVWGQFDAEQLFREANQFFREANDLSQADPQRARDLYGRAILRYERLIDEGGIDNGKLFYNLGNAYFQAGDIGRAVLNYRRAEEFIPSDSNLRQSLSYARSRRADDIQAPQRAVLARIIFFWHYGLSARSRAWIFGFLSLAFWGAMTFRLYRPGTIPRGALAAVGAVGALFLGSLVAEAASEGRTADGVIVSQEATPRKGDSESYEPAFTKPLHAGAEFRVIERRPGWFQIELPDERRCWIHENEVELIKNRRSGAIQEP